MHTEEYSGAIVTETPVAVEGTLFITMLSIFITLRCIVSVSVFSPPSTRLTVLLADIRSPCDSPVRLTTDSGRASASEGRL